MSNIYDIYRKLQQNRQKCRDEWSAAFLSEGGVSVEVTHYRLDEIKKAGLLISDKEGPDDVILFSEKKRQRDEEFVKGDYFIWENAFYLIYEDVSLVNKELNYKKQKAIECNVSFELNNKNMAGAFIGKMRRGTSTEELKNASTLFALEEPLLIIPFIDIPLIGERLVIGGKPWRISDYDSITNLGISYLYLKRDVFEEDEIPTYKDLPDKEEEDTEENILYALREYTFDSKTGYFAAIPAVEIISKSRSQVTFMIPFWGDDVLIKTKNSEGEIEEVLYKVVSL